MRFATPIGTVLLVALAACAPATGVLPAVPAGPADPNADMAPDLMVAPEAAAPGDVIALRFPEHTSRGIHFVLEVRDGDSWQYVYDLISSTDGGRPEWLPAGSEELVIPDIGIAGPGPDRVRIPEDAAPGSYRICTGNAGEEFCTPIEVAAGG